MVVRSVTISVGAPVGVRDRPQRAHERLEGHRPVVLRAQQQSDQVGSGRGVHGLSSGSCVVGSVRRDRRRCLTAIRCHDGQSWGVSVPHTSNSHGMPLSHSDCAKWRRGQGPRRVLLEGPRADHQLDVHVAAQPVEVVAVQVGHVGRRVVEVQGVAHLAPGVPAARVVVARHAHSVRRTGPRDAGRALTAWNAPMLAPAVTIGTPAAAVVVDRRRHLVGDPRVVRVVAPGALLAGDRRVGPRRSGRWRRRRRP